MNDFLIIWQGFFDIIVVFWNFIFSYQKGIIGAFIIVISMIVTLRLMFFRDRPDDK